MNTASKIFVQKNLELLADYTKMIDKDYASQINETDFQKPEIVSSVRIFLRIIFKIALSL